MQPTSSFFFEHFFFADVTQGRVIWSNVRKATPGVAIRGPRLEFRPFTLDHHQQYKCLIKSQRTNEILRTLIFDTHANIHEKIDRKPKLNLTMDTSRLFPQGELRLICSGGRMKAS